MADPSILWRSPSGSTILIDIPRSLEQAQVPPGQAAPRRLLSAEPVSAPYDTPEPKDPTWQIGRPPAALVAELMTQTAVTDALDEITSAYRGPWCLPRVVSPVSRPEISEQKNTDAGSPDKDTEMGDPSDYLIPPQSRFLHGTIRDFRDEFAVKAPKFDLILLDPPWPNRSARRKRSGSSYPTVQSLKEARALLETIPVPVHLTDDGLVAMWLTNKPSLAEMVTGPRGLLGSWGLEVLSEWTWLKVTVSGEPVYDVASGWRKPWEKLVVAGRKGRKETGQLLERRVLVAVPDLHSRKPCLRSLFDEVLPPGYTALEVFARGLTAGWWSWGEDVLQFQHREHWVAED